MGAVTLVGTKSIFTQILSEFTDSQSIQSLGVKKGVELHFPNMG